ncbi:TatD family hydrolase [Verrucomicrobiales bacterium]|jgi:TatD DNase family protein|nr:TatD family hydrolase [Verrucomicrobiales bacterium]
MGLIDAHLHLQDSRLAGEFESILSQLRQAGVTRWVVNGTSPEDWSRVAEIASDNPEVIAGYGLHPWSVNSFGLAGLEELEYLLLQDPGAVVGEIGLDKWIRDHDNELQKKCFLKQLEIANRLGRSTVIHCLQSWGSLRDCLKEVPPEKPFLLHSYGGPLEMIGDFLDRGAFFSISGYFFRDDKVKKLAVFDEIPSDRILLESDAPDMLPPPELIKLPLADGVNHPVNLVRIYASYAERVSFPLDEVIAQIAGNFGNWYQANARSKADERSVIE